MSPLSTARYNNARQYLNIDLGTISRLKRIATQGRYDADQWVTSYAVSYSMNNIRFIPYKEGRRIKVNDVIFPVNVIILIGLLIFSSDHNSLTPVGSIH